MNEQKRATAWELFPAKRVREKKKRQAEGRKGEGKWEGKH